MSIAVTGKTVYILGAGASHHTGSPLLNDFMVTARWLYETKADLDPEYKSSFKAVFDWVNELRSSSYYINFDLDNIEHLFSIAEMMKQLKMASGSEIYSNLRNVIMVTLDVCQVIKWQGSMYIPDPTYSIFIRTIKGFYQNKKQDRGDINLVRDSIITYNYDIAIDYCMMMEKIKPDYCLGETIPGDNVFRLLKLHGSSNFAICPKCSSELPYQKIDLVKGDFSMPLSDQGPKSSDMVSKIMKMKECSKCHKTTLQPLIIPPTWSKDVQDHPLSSVWSSAVDEVEKAQQIVVIGYSLPQTDTFYQYLLI